MANRINYGNWVTKKLIYLLSALLILCLVLSAAIPLFILKTLFFILSTFFLIILIYFLLSRQAFSYNGGCVSGKILDCLTTLTNWDGKGRALDIGAGSGVLAIKLAKQFPEAIIDGIDFWDTGWDYSKEMAEQNAAAEGVAKRISFTKASASKLPFGDETFDLVISNMTFHEVRDCKNKTDLIREALRVLKKGGTFVLHDLFGRKTVYNPKDIEHTLSELHLQKVTITNTTKLDFIPTFLKIPGMLSCTEAIYGIK